MNAPLGPVVERCTSNPVSLVELSRHETSIRLLDTGAALVLDAAFTEGPDPAVDAAAGRTGLSRDKLVAYLRPEADAEHARGLLKQACYALRRDLDEPDLLLARLSCASTRT